MKHVSHEFAEGWCKWCGGRQTQNPSLDHRTCLTREVPTSELKPEPTRRQLACEDSDTISARILELRKEQFPEGQEDPGDLDCG